MTTSKTGTMLLAVVAIVVTSCTTTIRPVQCQGEPHQCNEVHDAKFCEYEAVHPEGPDCAELGLAPSRHFCVVTADTCVLETSYEVGGHLCRLTQLEMIREGGECAPGLPTFMAP